MVHGSELDAYTSAGLGLYFLLLGLLNAWYTVSAFQKGRVLVGGIWVFFTLLLLGTSLEYYSEHGGMMPQGLRDAIDYLLGPVTYFLLSVIGFALVIVFRRFLIEPFVAWIILNATLTFVGFAMTDYDFRQIVAKPDNVPISMLIASVAFTTWIAFRQAVANDDRLAKGQKPAEADEAEKVLTWPDLVYTEMLAMVIGTIIIVVWSICLRAPLEPPAATTKIPNPSKAPWYFLGLQEMLVYFDPWLAGVVLPTYIILGLCAIPYIDYNKEGNGYYTFNQRKFAITTFLFGFVVLWVVLIVLGTFLRGPNWNFFGPFEEWSPYKTIALNNVNLSDFFWIDVVGTKRPANILLRELPGILIVLGYFVVVPLVLAKTVMRTMFLHMGMIRFMTMANILLMMAFLPIKMVLRWSFNLKYLINIPEYFFNV